jgi:hypothetical protein
MLTKGLFSTTGLRIHHHFGPGDGGNDISPSLLSISNHLLMGSAMGWEISARLADTLTANQNDWQPSAINWPNGAFWALTTTANCNVTGIDASAIPPDQLYYFTNAGGVSASTATVTFTHQDPLSLAANRFICPGGVGLAIPPGGGVILSYSHILSRWVIWAVATVAGSGSIPVHNHSDAAHGGNALLPDTIDTATLTKSDTETILQGELQLNNGSTTLAGGTYNDFSLSGLLLGVRIMNGVQPTGNIIFTGFDATNNNAGDFLILLNTAAVGSGLTITLNENDAGSLVNNRLRTGVGNITLPAASGVFMVRTPAGNRWQILGILSVPVVSTAGPDANITVDAAGAVGSGTSTFAESQHGHRVNSTVGPDANITIDAAGAAGTSGTLARSQHGHQVVTTDAPSGANISIDAAAGAAATGAIARAAHGHRLNTSAATPATINKTPVAGTATHSPSRDDHSHGVLGNQVQTVRASTGVLAAAGVIDVTITWPVSFGDTNYTVVVSTGYNDATARAAPTHYIRWETMTATLIKVRVVNNSAVSETMPVHAIGIHD